MYDRNFDTWLLYMADMRRCNALLKQGSRSFYAASMVLPKLYRLPIIALYAFCRVADDEIDTAGASEAALTSLRHRLDAIYAGNPAPDAVDRAFADVVRIYNIPQSVPAALLEGFAWDIDNREYASLSELYDYAARVAGTVGTMMAMIMGVKDVAVLSRACDLGVAMQLTNIARDVGEDASAGRLYLPREMLEARGIDPDAWLQDPTFTPALGDVVKELLTAAEHLYSRADWGLGKLPADCRPAMFAARWIYAEIGNEVARRGYDSVSQRAVVSGRRKLGLLGHALKNAFVRREADDAPSLQEVRFLLDAISSA